jgi:hypothetical protein
MGMFDPMESLPLWGIFVATIAVVLFSVEVGFRLARYQSPRSEEVRKAPIAEIVTAMLGLLAFMLGFTFSLAASRFDVRRTLVLEESNAIGTTYLRAGMLPEPHGAEIRKLLREYVKARLAFAKKNQVLQASSRSEELHGRLWAEATAVGEKNPNSIVAGLFISSLNDVIDLHSKRVTFSLRNRIPITIWAALYFLAFCAFGMMGFHMGVASKRRFLGFIPLLLTFSVVMFLIADLDRPREGLLKVSQQSLIDLLNSFNVEGHESKSPGVTSSSRSE